MALVEPDKLEIKSIWHTTLNGKHLASECPGGDTCWGSKSSLTSLQGHKQTAVHIDTYHCEGEPQSISTYVSEVPTGATWSCIWNRPDGESQTVADGWCANVGDAIKIAQQAGKTITEALR